MYPELEMLHSAFNKKQMDFIDVIVKHWLAHLKEKQFQAYIPIKWFWNETMLSPPRGWVNFCTLRETYFLMCMGHLMIISDDESLNTPGCILQWCSKKLHWDYSSAEVNAFVIFIVMQNHVNSLGILYSGVIDSTWLF